jgi:hypothetical protein
MRTYKNSDVLVNNLIGFVLASGGIVLTAFSIIALIN